MILAGDVGGTKVNLGIFETAGNTLQLVESANFPTRDYSGITDILAEFIKSTGQPQQEMLCLGVAGPVTGDHCRLTNIDWAIDAGILKDKLGFSEVRLINDLAAGAAGIPFLNEGDFEILQEGQPDPSGRKAIVSAGTGLGQAFLIPDGSGRMQVVDTEGGQCGLAAYSIEDLDIMQYFHGLGSPVSVEHVLSGEGLGHLYRYYRDRQGGLGSGGEAELNPTAEAIVARSRNEETGPCREAVHRFASFLGGVAGDLALQGLTAGGVYLGGGIAPAIADCLVEGPFLNSFNNRDKFHDWMKTIPVYLIRNERSPLWGAAGLVTGERVVMAPH